MPRLRGSDESYRRPFEVSRVARHDGVAVVPARGGCRDRVLEVGPAKPQGVFDNGAVHRGDIEYGEQTFGGATGRSRSNSFGVEVMQRRHRMGRQHAVGLAGLDGRPDSRRRLGKGPAIEQNVKDDVHVQQQALHRNLCSRYRW